MLLMDIFVLIDLMDNDEVRELYLRHQRYEDSVTELENLVEEDGASYSPMLVNRMNVVTKTRASYISWLDTMRVKYMLVY